MPLNTQKPSQNAVPAIGQLPEYRGSANGSPYQSPAPAHTLVDTRFLDCPSPDAAEVRAAHLVYERLIGIWGPGVIEAAHDLGIFEVLRVRSTAAQVAAAVRTDPRATRVLLDALFAFDIADREIDQGESWYVLSEQMRACLRPDSLYSLTGKIEYDRKLAWTAWRNLADTIRGGAGHSPTGESLNQISEEEYESLVHGINFWAPPIVRVLSGALRADGWSADQPRTMVDVGCGTGLYGQLLLQEFSGLAATGLDVARITPIAERQAKRLGVEDRFRTVTCDFWDSDWGGQADLVLFVNIFHLQTPASAAELCRKAADTLAVGGTVAIVDHIVDDSVDDRSSQNRFFRLFAASMLATGGGDAYQLDQYDQWLSDAGLRRTHLLDTPMHRILLARRA